MDCLNVKIDIAQAWPPPTPQGNDINLMDYFLAKGMTSSKLQSINQFRNYLQLLNLFDMTSADGRRLIPQVLQGHRLTDRRSTLTWPIQHQPTRADWLVWSAAFQPLSSREILLKPIDMSSCQLHQEWLLYLDTNHNLFQFSGPGEWKKYPQNPAIRVSIDFTISAPQSMTPASSDPTPPHYSSPAFTGHPQNLCRS
jgi:hypothetical protein